MIAEAMPMPTVRKKSRPKKRQNGLKLAGMGSRAMSLGEGGGGVESFGRDCWLIKSIL